MADSVGTFSVVGLFDDTDIRRKLQGLSGEATQAGAKIGQGLGQGFEKGSQSAAQAGASAERAAGSFTKAGREMQTAANGLKFYTDATGRARQSNVQLAASLQTAEAGLKGVAASSGLAAGALGTIGTAAAALLPALGVAEALRFAFSEISAADDAAAAVRTLGVNSDELRQRLRGLSGELQANFSQVDLLKASYDVASSGFSTAAEASNILEASAKGAVGGFADLNTVAKATTAVINAYGLTSDDAARLVDQFVQTQNDGVITVREYAEQVGRVASIAAAAGVSIEEVNAAIATATLKGVRVESAFTGLTQAISSILKPSREATDLANSLGIDFSVAALNAKGLAGVLEDVRAKTGGAADKIAILLGSVEAQQVIQPLLNDNLVKYNELLGKQASATGTAAAAADTAGRTFSNSAKQLRNSLSNLASAGGEGGLAGGAANQINEYAKAINTLAAAVANLQKVKLPGWVGKPLQQTASAVTNPLEGVNRIGPLLQGAGRFLTGEGSASDKEAAKTSTLLKEVKSLTDSIGKSAAETGDAWLQSFRATDRYKAFFGDIKKSAEDIQKTREKENEGIERQLSLIGQVADAEEKRGRAGVADLQARLQVIDALVARENAYRSLQEALFDVELSRARARGASPGEIEGIEQRALVAQVEAAQRRFEVERVTLALKQQQAAIEQQLAVNAAQRAVAEAAVQFAQAVNNGESADMLATRREIYGLLEQQLRLEQQRTQTLPALQQIERETLGIQEQATAAQLRATAAAKGWENDLAAPLSTLQRSADAFRALENTDLRGTVYPATTAAMGLATAMWDAQRASAQFVQDLRAAAGIEPARWAGGPVVAGQGYRINELGQEAFLSRTGDLSLITAPTNARWIPPTEGTVIPAAFTRVLKERGMFDRISRTTSPSMVAGPQRVRRGRDQAAVTARLAAQVAVLSQEVRALHRKDWSVRVGVRQREGAISFANRLAALR